MEKTASTSRTKKRVLVAYSKASTYTPTTVEYLTALRNFTDYDVDFVHVTHDARMNFDMNAYDVVYQNYCARLCFEGYVSEDYQRALMNFRGLKILAVQDDYDRTATLHRAIRRLGFHVLLTCIQRDFWPLAYPRSEIPGVKILQGLTGYMPENLLKRHASIARPLAGRDTWVAYRGRDIGARYGRLGYDKLEIGRYMKEACATRGIPHNIAMDHESRIYGDAWFDFLGSSRTMLGSESASNVFDFDGDVEHEVSLFAAKHGHPPTYHDFQCVVDPIEKHFDVGQISPRIFECALMRTPMILFRGRYSDAITADKHYIALEKDFSNIEAVLALLGNLDYLQGFADRAYDKLVTSGDYGYRSLARLLSDAIEEQYGGQIDTRWVEFRAQTAKPWKALATPQTPETEEEARQIAYAETPTKEPLGLDDLRAREAEYSRIINEMSARSALATTNRPAARPPSASSFAPSIPDYLLAGMNATPFYSVARGVWRMMPAPIRRLIRTTLGRIHV